MRVNAEHPTCPRCDTVLGDANPTLTGEATCENCGTHFTWQAEASMSFHCKTTPKGTRPAVTVSCTAEDMELGLRSGHALNLRQAWESADPEWLHDAVMSAAAHLDKLAQIEHQTVKGPLPGQEIKFSDLEALPYGSLVSDSAGDYWEKHPSGEWNCYQFLDTAPISEEYGPFTFESL